MPDRLARTSAFVPRKVNLITDSNFTRVYEVPGYSVVEVLAEPVPVVKILPWRGCGNVIAAAGTMLPNLLERA